MPLRGKKRGVLDGVLKRPLPVWQEAPSCGHSEIVQTAEVSTDDILNAYGACFNQGMADDVADMEQLAARALEFMLPEQRDALRAYLRDALDRLTPSELKGKVNRAIREYGFNSKSAVAFLRATADQLERRT
jgi:hypothetical protein